MADDQILDDFENVQPIQQKLELAIWKFRMVGTFRMTISLVTIFSIISNIISLEYDGTYYDIEEILFSLLFVFPIIYHLKQGWVELSTKEGFAKKRRFRIAGMVLCVVIILGLILSSLFSVLDVLISTRESLGVVIGRSVSFLAILALLISILRMDNRYIRFNKKNKLVK